MDNNPFNEATTNLNDGDDQWTEFSAFLDKIFLFCNRKQDLVAKYSSIDQANLIEECFNDSILISSIKEFTKEIFKELNSHSKDDEEAAKLRKDGNDLFRSKMYSDALECYSAAILKAEKPKDLKNDHNELSLAYANRSAAFFNLQKFENAFEDAQKALKLDHYDKEKLQSRIHKCKLMIEQKSERKQTNEQKTLFTNNKISLDFDEQKGRKLIANKPIEMGECLISENAFVSMVNRDYYLAFCNCCLKQLNGYGIPCDLCDYAIYCSEFCLNQVNYHRDECGKISDLINQLGVGYLVLRLAFKVGLNEMIDSIESKQNDCDELTSTYQDVYNLMSHEDEFEIKENLSFALVSLFFKQLLDNHSRYTVVDSKWIKLCKLFLRHIQQLSTNLISIDQNVALDIYDEGSEMNEKLKAGIGFYPVTSLLNHSCLPNVIPKFTGNHLEITALKFIEKDAEILFCYGPSFYEDTRSDRQKMLKTQYFFECQCMACESNEENKQRAFLCDHCKGPVIYNKDKTNFCFNCKLTNQSVNEKLYDESLMLIRIAKKKFGLEKFEDALVDVNEAYTKLVDCVHRHHKELRTCLNLLADCYHKLGHYSVASQYHAVNLKLIKEIYGPKSVESLNVFMKICNLDFLCCEEDADKREKLKKFIDSNIQEFECLECEVARKVEDFKGFDEIKAIKEIRSKI